MPADWLEVHEGAAPLVVSFPHTGTDIPPEIERRLVSPWIGRKDADWWVDQLYAFARDLGATTVRTRISRTVIDVNRDPSGASLYPGQATTELCPTTTFDGEPLYQAGARPADAEIAARRREFFEPYHAEIRRQINRLRGGHARVVLYDAHSIRSRIPRLFADELPHFNIGTNGGATCALALAEGVVSACDRPGFRHVLNGRFKGGWTTRHYGQPAAGVHAIQMELACRAYLDEPDGAVDPQTWPPPLLAERSRACRAILTDILQSCLAFAEAQT